MSYDIYVDYGSCGHCGRASESVDVFSYTRNVSQIVDRCLGAAGAGVGRRGEGRDYSWWRLDGWPVTEALPIAERALAESWKSEREAEFRMLEPDNGWGDLEGVRRVMAVLVKALREHPGGVIGVSG